MKLVSSWNLYRIAIHDGLVQHCRIFLTEYEGEVEHNRIPTREMTIASLL